MPSSNAMMVIFPYRHHESWVFDDDRVGLVREPFVGGVTDMIDILVDDIPGAESGFRLLFSAGPFPGFDAKLDWLKAEYDGAWYRWEARGMEGWLCPAMFHYFESAPEQLYCKAEACKSVKQ